MNGLPLPITGTGEETRDFTYVGDLVNGLVKMATHEEAVGEAINLGAGREIRIIDLANWINELTGNEAGILYKERRDWDKRTGCSPASIRRAISLDTLPRLSSGRGLKRRTSGLWRTGRTSRRVQSSRGTECLN